MAEKTLQGMWKLVSVTRLPLSSQKIDVILHFVDDRFFYERTGGWLTRHRYHLDPSTNPASIDVGHSSGIYSLSDGTLLICKAAPGDPRPTSFGDASVSVYEYAGPGPTDWRTLYKRQMRSQLED